VRRFAFVALAISSLLLFLAGIWLWHVELFLLSWSLQLPGYLTAAIRAVERRVARAGQQPPMSLEDHNETPCDSAAGPGLLLASPHMLCLWETAFG
jgi:hypothetical protein